MITGIIPHKQFKVVQELPALKTSSYFINIADDLTINFLNDLSKIIVKESFFKPEPSFIALGFWLRRTNIKRILSENKFLENSSAFIVKPIGKVFHLCPSNVDTMFIYSMVLALLAGNKNVVRISSKLNNDYIFKLFKLFNDLLEREDYKRLIEYINVVTYERSDILNEEISLQVNGRIIWGGDETVSQFKKYKTKPKVKDLFFTDKVSLSLINIDDEDDFNRDFEHIINNLYNDIYTFNQKGCSSPHSLFIVSKSLNKQSILHKIYLGLSELASSNYDEDISSIASLKLNQSAIDIIENRVTETLNSSNYITFSKLENTQVPHSCGAGYLYYNLLENIYDIRPYIDNKTQTITYTGLSKAQIIDFLDTLDVEMVDRVVPLGKALDFDYIWDGYNIFMEMLSFKSIK